MIGRLASLCLLAGCSVLPTPVDTYLRSRGADVLDVVPISVAYGRGVSMSARATAFLHVGVGFSPVVSTRAGFADRMHNGLWHEYQVTFPWVLWVEELADLPDVPEEWGLWERGIPIVYRWRSDRDAPQGEGDRARWAEPIVRQWGRHPSVTIESMGAFGLPEVRRSVVFHDLRREQDSDPLAAVGSPTRASYWEASRDGPLISRDWDLVELDASVLVFGLRVGIRPLQVIDLVTGLFGLDLWGDDLPAPGMSQPVPFPQRPIQSDPIQSDPIQSDPIQSDRGQSDRGPAAAVEIPVAGGSADSP